MRSWRLALALIWLLTTLSLAGWWLIFGLRVVSDPRHYFMLLSEGSFLLILLLVGGLSLIYFIHIEIRRSRQMREFFAAFTHDLKTSIASLRLQAETLEEELKDSSQGKVIRRLVKDTVRLELQLDNSLFLSNPESTQLYIQDHSIAELVQSLRHSWPELNLHIQGDARVKADQRALESIFKNLIQNAVVHGKATNVKIVIDAPEKGRVRVQVLDNGGGFNGEYERLGEAFLRHRTTSGSGLGLYMVKQLTARMGGQVFFVPHTQSGFAVELQLQGEVV